MPALLIAAVLAIVGILGSGTSSGIDKKGVEQEVNALLAGISQEGATLGSPGAPLALQVFADLECPTVRRFVLSYLPSIVDTWVRDGSVKLEYRSLETDTLNERTFFRQEVAALAAGRQNRMWNFALTFVHEQQPEFTGYATDAFLAEVASQVPGIDQPRWRRDREEALLTERVARGVHAAHSRGFRGTPSFLLTLTRGKPANRATASEVASLRKEVEPSLERTIASLRQETSQDNPALRRAELANRKEARELTEIR